jgi:hypothetical protein
MSETAPPAASAFFIDADGAGDDSLQNEAQ